MEILSLKFTPVVYDEKDPLLLPDEKLLPSPPPKLNPLLLPELVPLELDSDVPLDLLTLELIASVKELEILSFIDLASLVEYEKFSLACGDKLEYNASNPLLRSASLLQYMLH